MPRVRLPDGRIVNVKEGATQADVLAEHSAPPISENKLDELNLAPRLAGQYVGNAYEDVSKMGAIPRFAGGMKASLDSAALGLKSNFTDLTPEDRAQLAQGDAFVDQGGAAAKLGGFATDVAVMAAPQSKVASVIKGGAEMIPVAGRVMAPLVKRILPEMLAGGTVSAAFSPDDKLEAFGAGAAGELGGRVAGKVIKRGLGGVFNSAVTPEAQLLIDQGVDVPIWKSTASPALRNVGERIKSFPVAGHVMASQESKAIQQWNKSRFDKANPPTPVMDPSGVTIAGWETRPISEGGSKGLAELHNKFGETFDTLYGGNSIPDVELNASRMKLNNHLVNTKKYDPGVFEDTQGAVNEALDTLNATVGDNGVQATRIAGKHTDINHAVDNINERISQAYKDGKGALAKQLEPIRDELLDLRMRGLPPEVRSQVAPVNLAYRNFLQLVDAMGGVNAQKNDAFSPGQMLAATKKGDKSARNLSFSKGEALNQQDTLNAQRVMGSTLPEVGPGTAEKMQMLLPFLAGGGAGAAFGVVDAGVTGALLSPWGRKALVGRVPGQKAIRQFMDETGSPAARYAGTALGAQMLPQNELERQIEAQREMQRQLKLAPRR